MSTTYFCYSHNCFICIPLRRKYRIFIWIYILKEIQRLQEDTDKANKHSSVLERDNQRMEIQVKDLSQQVRSFSFSLFPLNWQPSNVWICLQLSKRELPHLKFSSIRNTTLAELQPSLCFFIAPTFFTFVFKCLINEIIQRLKNNFPLPMSENITAL